MKNQVEDARSEDLQEILALYKELNPGEDFSDLERFQPIWQQILSPSLPMSCLVIRQDGVIAASAILAILPNLSRNGRSYGVVENVIVSESHRRKGLGRRLMEECKRRCREQNCYKLMFLSSASRTEAHSFYESLGFDGDSKKGFQIRW